MTIGQAINNSIKSLKNTSKTPALDAEVLLCNVLKKNKAFVYAHPKNILSERQYNQYEKYISRRLKGEPVAYITKTKEFFGLDFLVNKNVLIPRPETEAIVELVLDLANKRFKYSKRINICDVGTGSGCISISLAKNIKNANISAIDISENALSVAKINAKKHKVYSRINFKKSDLLFNIKKIKRFDFIVANLPYISNNQYEKLDKDIKNFEPKSALFAKREGMDYYIKLLSQIPNHIKKDGYVLFEIDPSFKNKIIKKATEILGIKRNRIKIKSDLLGKDRILLIDIT